MACWHGAILCYVLRVVCGWWWDFLCVGGGGIFLVDQRTSYTNIDYSSVVTTPELGAHKKMAACAPQFRTHITTCASKMTNYITYLCTQKI